MGVYADRTATKYEISREAQDEYTIQSYKRSAQSFANNLIQKEIATITIAQKKADPILVTEDEEYKKVDFSKISSLRPIFTADGTVTAASSSTMNDGASAMVLMSGKKVKELNLKPLARIVSYADAEHEPAWYTTAPATAAPIALKRGGLGLNDIDFFEVNEAFAVVPLKY
jgi:acetyl-CoA C-acetyltransferase